jgi:hypothetical protein
MIKEMLQNLLLLEPPFWDSYAMRREPLIGRISAEQKIEFTEQANRCGKFLADEVYEMYGKIRPEAYAQKLGLTVEHISGKDDGNYTMFACFNEPDHISVFQETIKQTDLLIEEQGLAELLGKVHTEDILIAHELYHYFECARPELYTNRRLLKLWKIGRLQNLSKVVSLQEIGAMAFAQQLLQLPYSPFVFDVLLLSSQNKRLAKKLYESILNDREIKG